MKTIVLATDFSKNAIKASILAAKLAGALKYRLLITHVYQTPLNIFPSEAHEELIQKVRKAARAKLYRLRTRLRREADSTPSIDLQEVSGNTLDSIKLLTTEQHVDLLVMGTMGNSSPGARYFGSQATEMILDTAVPLLLVPPGSDLSLFKNIAVAIDLRKSVDASALDKLMVFAQKFEAVLDLICVCSNPDDPAIQKAGEHIRHLLLHQPHTMTIVDSNDLAQTITEFEKQNKTDLLVMLPQPHNQLLYSLLESLSQQIARQSDIPVLAIV